MTDTPQRPLAMTTLLERLEGASEGSRELDARVECAVQGFDFIAMHHGWYVAGKGGARQQLSPPDPYTTSIDAALALAERVLPGKGTLFLWEACVSSNHPDEIARLLCAALLRASAAEGAGQ